MDKLSDVFEYTANIIECFLIAPLRITMDGYIETVQMDTKKWRVFLLLTNMDWHAPDLSSYVKQQYNPTKQQNKKNMQNIWNNVYKMVT